MDADRQTAALVDRLRAGVDSFNRLRDRVEVAARVPSARAELSADEGTWDAREILAHVSEMLPFWLGEIERILSGHDEPAAFGRCPHDTLRSGIIERDRSLPAGELYARIQSSSERVAGRLSELTEPELARLGQHPVRGPMSVYSIADQMIVGHLEEHAAQLEETLTR